MLIGPIGVVFAAYRAYLSEHSKSEGLQFLYRASELLSGARDLEGGLLALLDFARETFHAEIAEVVLRGEHDEAIGYRTCAGPGDRRFRLEPCAADHVDAIIEVAAEGHDVVQHRPSPTSPLAQRDGIDVASMLVATVRDESGVRGAALVARPSGAVFEDVQQRRGAPLRNVREPPGHDAREEPSEHLARAAPRPQAGARAPGVPRLADRSREPAEVP